MTENQIYNLDSVIIRNNFNFKSKKYKMTTKSIISRDSTYNSKVNASPVFIDDLMLKEGCRECTNDFY